MLKSSQQLSSFSRTRLVEFVLRHAFQQPRPECLVGKLIPWSAHDDRLANYADDCSESCSTRVLLFSEAKLTNRQRVLLD
mmetsp:Transcript_43579/g.105675  ORF Transcript_43579/g.105675 Transcript_43579/m.105675 type:complete len:80 (-) Transcript_43579:134-373(-)